MVQNWTLHHYHFSFNISFSYLHIWVRPLHNSFLVTYLVQKQKVFISNTDLVHQTMPTQREGIRDFFWLRSAQALTVQNKQILQLSSIAHAVCWETESDAQLSRTTRVINITKRHEVKYRNVQVNVLTKCSNRLYQKCHLWPNINWDTSVRLMTQKEARWSTCFRH